MHYRGWDEMSFDAHDVNVDYDFCAKSTCNMQLRGKKRGNGSNFAMFLLNNILSLY